MSSFALSGRLLFRDSTLLRHSTTLTLSLLLSLIATLGRLRLRLRVADLPLPSFDPNVRG